MGRAVTFPHLASLPRRARMVYALQTSDGLVKVGLTTTPFNRLSMHEREFRRRGVRMREYVVGRVQSDIYWTEQELIARMTRCGRVRPGTREWFEGVAWGVARNLVLQVARRQFVVLGRS